MRNYRGYKFRLYPNKEQEEQLRKIFAAVHFTYNKVLIRWVTDPGVDFRAALEEVVRENPWLEFINRSILVHAVANLEKACRNNVKEYGPLPPGAGEMLDKSGRLRITVVSSGSSGAEDEEEEKEEKEEKEVFRKLPRFKTIKDRRESFTITASNDVFIRYNKLTLGGQRGLKPIRVVQSRALPRGCRVCSATVSRNRSGEYYVSLLCSINSEIDPDEWRRTLGYVNGMSVVGLDYSFPYFFVASDSYLRPDERYLHNAEKSRNKLAAAQRLLSRMQKGSANYEKQTTKISRIYRNISNQRRDYLQKLSTQIAERYDIVCVETLDLIEMEQHGKGFARRVQDNAWNEFVAMLDYKLRERGKKLVKVGKRFPSTRRCHECSYINRELTLSDREWTCPVCGVHHNRDINASLNIRDEGIRILFEQEKNRRSDHITQRKSESPEFGNGPYRMEMPYRENAEALQVSDDMRPYLMMDPHRSEDPEHRNLLYGYMPVGDEYNDTD